MISTDWVLAVLTVSAVFVSAFLGENRFGAADCVLAVLLCAFVFRGDAGRAGAVRRVVHDPE